METVTKRTQARIMQILAWIISLLLPSRPVAKLQPVIVRKRVKTLLFVCALLLGSVQGWGQNALNSGDFSGGTWGTAQNMSASAGGSLIITKGVTSTGDKFFRFYGDGSPCGEYQPNANGDLFTHNTVVTSPNANCGSSNAWKINVPTTTSNVVFKTDGGNDGMDRAIAFVIRGTVRTISSVSISPAAPASTQSATVTAGMSGGLATGHGVYLRYTTDNFASSTILSMSNSSGNNYTATIPAQPTGTVVKYYVFTSGNGLTIAHADADFYTINLNNNSGNNYSYTSAPVTRYAVANGNWNATSTWSTTSGGSAGATVPQAGDVVVIESGNTVTVTASTSVGTLSFGSSAQNVGNLVVNNGVTLTVTGSTSVDPRTGANSQSATISGAGTLNLNGLTVGSTLQTPSGTQTITLTSTIAAMNISGNLTLTSDFATNSSNVYIPRFYINEGVVTLGGVITPNVQNTAGDIYFRMDQGSASGTLILNNAAPWGTDVDLIAPWGSGTNSTTFFLHLNGSNSTVIYNAAGNQTINRARYATTGTVSVTYTNLTIAGSGNKDLPSTSTATVNGTFSIQGTATLTTSSPTYGPSSTLRYFTGLNYNRGLEWTTATSGAGYPNNVQISNPGTVTTLNMGSTSARCAGNLTLDASNNITTTSGGLTVLGNIIFNGGYTLGGDVYAGGDYTVGASATVNNNNKAVFFNKATGNQTIARTGGGIVYFDYLVIDKATSGNAVLGTSTNVEINTTTGSVLQLNNSGGLDLNGNTFTLNGTGGNILTSGTSRNIISSSSGANFIIGGNKSVTSNLGGSLVFGSNVNVKLNAGLNFGAGLSTVNSTLEIGSGGFVDVNAPTYGASSTLVYATGGTYGRTLEWSANSGAGYPANVTINNGSGLDLGNGATGTARQLSGNLTVNGGLYMDFGNNDMTQSLTVLGNVVVGASGQLSLSDAVGGDLDVKGNWTNNGGTFSPKSRTVTFSGTGTQTITKTGGETFDFLTVNKSAGSLNLSNDITCNQTLTLTNGDIVTGANKVIISSTGSVSGGATASHIVGNLQHYFATGSNVAKTYPIGDGTNYSPATITLGSVTTAGTINLSVTASVHPNLATIALSSTKYINRYWSATNSSTVFTGGSIAFNYVAGDLQGGAAAANLLGARYTTSSTSWSYPTTTGQAAHTFTCTGITNTNIQDSYTAAECGTTSSPTAGNASKTYDGLTNTTSVSATPGAGQTIDWYLNATGGSALSSGSTTYVPTAVNAGTYTVYAEARNSTTGCLSATRTAVTLTINQKTLTITGLTGDNKVYDRTTAATASGTAALSGVVSGDVVTLSGTPTFTFASANVGTGISISTTGYTLSGASAANYTLTQPTLSANITALGLTITGLTGNNKVYDRTTSATASGTATLSGVISGDVVTLSGTPTFTFASANVGTGISISTTGYSLTGANASNYSLTQPTLSANITAATLTITGLTGVNKVYDRTTAATATGTAALSGVFSGDVVTLSGTPTFTFATANVGTGISISTTGYTLGGANAGNYSLTQPTLSANITAVGLTITGLTGNNKEYDRTTAATASGTAALSGVLSGDVVTLGGTPTFTFATSNVGTGISISTTGYTLTGANAGNYTLTQPTLSANITQKGLTVTGLTGANKVYDRTTTATATGTAALSGVISPDAVTLSGTPTFTFASANAGTGIAISVSGYSLTGANAANYSLTQPSLSANITAKALTVTGVTVTSKVYDKTNTATLNTASAALTGVISPDVVTLDATGAAGTFASVNAGSGISVTATGFSLGGAAAANYSVTQPTGLTGAITPRPVTLTGTRAYDGTDIALASDVTISNNLDGPSLTLTGSGTLDLEDVGTRTISAPTSLSRVQSATGTTGSANGATSCTVTLGAAPANGNTLIAVVSTRNNGANTVSNISQTGTTWSRATQATNNSGVTTEIWYAEARSTSGASVTITLNTSISTKVSAAVMEYRGVLALNPLDVVNNNTGASTAPSTNSITTTQANELIIAGIGHQNSGTLFSNPTNSFSVVASATTTDNPGGNNVVTSALERIVTSTGTYSTGGSLDGSRSWSAAIASFKASIPSGNPFALGGAAAGNYTLTGMTGTMTVTQKALSITAPTIATKEYDGTATSGTVTVGTLSGVVSPETVGVTATGTYADANVGTGKTATIVYTLSDGTNGGKASNYSLANGSATGNITAKALTITANDQSKCEGSALNFTGNEFSSSGLVSGQSISGVTFNSSGASAGAAVGTYTIVPSAATGSTISNYNISYVNGTLTVNPSNPATISIASSDADNSICPGTSVTFTATPVNGGASPSYQWKLNGVNVGTNSTTYTTTSLANGDQVMVVMSYAATSCLAAANTNSNIITTTVNPAPTAFNVTGGGGYCSGGSGVSIGLSGSESGISYQLVRGGATNVGSPVSGTGSAISFGLQSTAGTYTIVATNNTTTCTNNMTGSVTVAVNTIPSAPAIGTITQPTCTVPTGSVQLTGLPATGTWTVTIYPGGTTASGSGAIGTINALPDATTYTFTVTSAEGCTSAVSGNAVLNPRPAIPSAPLGTDGSRCGTGTINLFADPIGSNQAIDWYATASGGSALLSGNTQFATSSISSTTIYYAEARFTTTGCVSATRTAVTATINATPTITASSTASGVTYGVSSSSLNYTATSGSPTMYSISWNATPSNNFVAVTDAELTASPISITIPTSTAVGTYTGTLSVKTINGCSSSSSNFTLAVTAAPLTITGLTANNKSYDATTTATLSGTAVYTGLQYGEVYSVIGSASVNFNTAAVGNNKPVTLTGYTAPSSNYTLMLPSFTANITAAPLSITIDEVYKAFNTTLPSPVTGFTEFVATGLAENETIGSITVSYGTGAASSAAVGNYTNTAVPSAATGGTFTASNYSITYVPNNIVVGNYKFAWITGNWDAANMWSSNSGTYTATSAPTSTDIVVIRRQNTVTVNTTNAVCGRIELGGTGANTEGFLTFSSTGSPKLTVSGQVVIGGYGSTNINRRGEVNLVSGATLEAEDIVLTRSTVGNDNPGVFSMATGGTLIANSILLGQGTAIWTAGTGTVIFSGTNNFTLPSAGVDSFYNLTINANKLVNTGRSIVIAGTMTVNGTFTPGATTHVISGAGTLTGSGEIDVTLLSATALTSQFSITNRNLSNMTVEYRGAGNQSMAASTYGNLVTAGSGTKTLLGTTTVNGNLTIGANTTLNDGGQSLNVKGNWTNSGTFTQASGTVTFNGTGTQTITGNSNFNNFVVTNSASNISLASGLTLGVAGTFTPNGTSFGSQSGSTINFNGANVQTIPAFNFVNLNISGGGAKSLSGDVTVSNVMSLTSGDVTLGNNNLTLSSANGLSGGSASSHIITNGTGLFRRTIGGAAAYLFPMGSTTDYNPVTYTWSSAPGITQLDASYTTATASIGSGLPTVVFGCALASEILNNGYWSFTPTGTLSNNPSVTVGRLGHTNAALRFSSHGIIRRANSSDDWSVAGVWVDNGNTLVSPANTGNVALTQSGLTSFGEIAVAKGTGQSALGLWIGAVNGQAENAANWGCSTVPTSSVDVVIPRNVAYQPTILNGDIECKSLTINTGALLRIAGDRTISIAADGHFTNNGTFQTQGSIGTVSFAGAATVAGESATTFHDLVLNGATTFTTVPTIDDNLFMNTGASVSASPNYSSSAILVYNSTASVNAGLEWIGNGTSVAAGSPNNITVQNSGTVTLSGNRSVPATFTMSNGVVAVGDNTLSLYGDVTVTGGSFTSGATGTVLYNKQGDNQTVPAGNYGNLTLNNFSKVLANSGTIGVAGTFTPGAASHTTTGSTISFNGSSAQNIPAFNYNNVIVAGSNTKTAAAGLTVAGNVTISSTFDAGAFSHAIGGNWINNGTFTHGGGTIQFNGTSAISGSSENTFNNVLITGALTAPDANMNVAGNWTINGGTFTPGTGTVTLNNTQEPQSIGGTASAFSFNNLTIANAGQTISLQGSPIARKSLNVDGNLTLNSGTFSTIFTDVNMSGGNWTNNGATFTSGGSKVIFNGTNGNQAINGTASTQTFARLEMNKPGRTLSLGGSTTRLNVTDTFALVAGTYDAGTTDSLRIGNNWVITGGTFSPGVSTVAFDGELAQVVPAQAYHKLSIIGSGTKTANGNITINDELNISNGKELDLDTYQLVDGGTLNTTGSGTLRTKNTGTAPLPNGKTWSFGVFFEGAGEQTLSNGTYNGGVTINNSSNGAKMNGNVTAASVTLSSGDLAIQSNTLTLNGSFSGSSNNALRGSASSNLTVGNGAAAGILYFRNSGTNNFIKDLRFMSAASGTLGNRLNVTAGAAAGKVKVEANSSLASNGNLVLKSDTLGTAYVDEIANCTTCTPITGEVEVERAMPNRRTWRLVTIPVTGSYTLRQQLTRQGPGAAVEYPAPYCNGSAAPAASGYGTMITGHSMSSCTNAAAVGADLITTGGSSSVRRYTFLNNTGSWASNNTTNAINFNAAPDQDGYLMFIRGDRSQLGSGSNATTFRFKGTLKQGNAVSTQTVNASYGVMSNPYAAPINVDDVFNNGTGNASKFDRNVWVWDGEKVGANGLGGYRSLSYDGVSAYTCGDCGTNAEGQQFLTLNSGQAFMVQRKADVTTAVSMTVKEEDKVSSTGNIATMRTSANARLTNSTVPSFRVQMHRANGASLESFADATTARFNKLYQANANEPYDVYKYNNNDENISLVRDRKYLVIESRPVPTTTDTLYLPFWNVANRGYALSIQTENFNTPGLAAELIDSFTNTRTQVPLNGSTLVYPFSVTSNAASKSLSRFRVVFTQGSSLPVNFVNVRAQVKNGSMVQVDWEVANEENLYQYEVERSADGKEFTKMAEQTPRNVATNHTYSWMDVRPNAGNNFYRIKALDNDGTFRYSATVKVNTGGAVQDVRVYPTTLEQPTVSLELTDQPAGIYEISMSNALGQMIFNRNIQHTGGNAVMTLDLSSYTLTAGVHFFTIKDQDGNKKSVKLIVKK